MTFLTLYSLPNTRTLKHNTMPRLLVPAFRSNRGFRGFWELTDYPTMHQRRRHHLQCVGNGVSRSCYDHHSLVKRFAVHFSDNQTFLIKFVIFDMCVLTFKFGMFHLYISNRPCTNEYCFWILMTLGRFEFWHALRSSPNETSVKACRVVWRLSWDKLARFRGLIICAYQHASWCKQRSEQTSNVPFRATWPVCGGRLHLPLFIVVCQFRTSSRKICETFHKTWTFRTSDRTAYSRLYPSSCTQYQHWRWCSTLFRYCWSEVSDCDK